MYQTLTIKEYEGNKLLSNGLSSKKIITKRNSTDDKTSETRSPVEVKNNESLSPSIGQNSPVIKIKKNLNV